VVAEGSDADYTPPPLKAVPRPTPPELFDESRLYPTFADFYRALAASM